MKGLSGKFEVSDTMSKKWLYLVYIIYTGDESSVDLLMIMWNDFWKFVDRSKSNEILNLWFWALNLQQLYSK